MAFSYLVVKTGGKSESWGFPPSMCMFFPDYMHSCLPRCSVCLSEERKTWGLTPFPGKNLGQGIRQILPAHAVCWSRLWNAAAMGLFLRKVLFVAFGMTHLQREDGNSLCCGKSFFPWWLENMGLLFWKSRAHPHSTQTMWARPGAGPKFSMNRTERRASDPLPICKGILEAIAQERKCHTCP